jgi:D-tagatose-1,6-bisphosphate aldolase subunit GatZ/KbaZ
VSQYLPVAFAAFREGRTTLDPADLAIAHISATLDAYYGACHPNV